MKLRTVKGAVFTILVDDKRIVGKRCRVIVPPGVLIEEERRPSAIVDHGKSGHSDEVSGEL